MEEATEKQIDILEICKKLEKTLDPDRMWHTLGVMNTAAALAMRYGFSIHKAQLAGVLHDCAKCIPNKKKLKLCKEYEISITAFEKEHPFLLHAKLGACLAQDKYGIDDPEVLSAITWHTTGRAAMTELEKIIYIADYIEPARDKAPRLEEIRYLAFQDLDRCIYEILKDTIFYIKSTGNDTMDETSLLAFEYYERLCKEE